MSAYRGVIGIKNDAVETSPGIFSSQIERVSVSGKMITKPVRWSSGELSQDSVTATQVLSIITPEKLMGDFSRVVYVEWHGRKWVVRSIEYKRPRVHLTLGGLYHE